VQAILFQASFVELGDILIANADGPLVGDIDAAEQVQQGCFPAAAHAHNGHRLARLQIQIHARQRRDAGGSGHVRFFTPRISIFLPLVVNKPFAAIQYSPSIR
jgi:hypothetical protein